MNIRWIAQRAGWAAALVAASMLVVPMASARVHVGVGISVPGLTVGVGNCWRCGYRVAPPVYYQPVYPAPVYYPVPVYYAPRPAYYGYGYYTPYYRHYYRGHYRTYRGRHAWHGHGGYYHRHH